MSRVCTIDGCDNKHEARGWCVMHYRCWRRNGSPLPPSRPTLKERLLSSISENEEGCWLWRGSIDAEGYGRIGRNQSAHRVAYELLVGPIPQGLTIDHLCRVRHCVNPAHLEPVTMAENLRRGMSFSAQNAVKTHCNRGHPYDEINTYRHGHSRFCRACGRHRTAAYKARKTAKAGAL